METSNANVEGKVNRVAIYHDLVVELGRIELHLESQGETGVSETVLARRNKLQTALRHLGI